MTLRKSVLANRTHKSKLNIEVAGIQLYDTPKNARVVHPLGPAWQAYIKALNGNDDAKWDNIKNPIWGPSVGVKNGKLMLISLGYWLNGVHVLETNIKGNGGPFARLACLGLDQAPPDLALINNRTSPSIIHRVTFENKKNQQVWTGNDTIDHIYIPLIAAKANQLFVPMSVLRFVN